MPLHGSCAARDGDAVLLLGPPGSGKSDLLLRLLHQGWTLVADDQVEVTSNGQALVAAAPLALSGLLELRGLGLLQGLPVTPRAPLRLVARLVAPGEVPRLPGPTAWHHAGHDLPALSLDPFAASAPEKLGAALDVVLGRKRLAAGFA